eukprot:CAMPEP_0113568616 /NCGR_PEP_ID=MMETSP0015_2-20120614/23947_1 /TAXON_ID=2838 /ORGANISM="Odontella" /LENGTH=413 /DNA_ID=CAMNT_0000471175 /DNA_START=157 /DNA_END=1394 /DNA_ORIENTATION=- /assembly_acc=CAM_ASM_000160
MADVLPKDEKERGSETAGAPAEAESRRHDGGGDHEDQPAGTDEGDESGGTEEPAAVEAVTDDGGGSAEGPTEKEKAPPPNSSEPPVDDSSAGAAEAGVEMAGKRLGRKDVEEIPPGMIESATSLADMEKSPGPAAAGKDGDGGGIKHRGEKRPAAAEATPPTPPPTEKPPPPNQISRQGGSGGTGPEPANLGAAGDAARKKAGKQRRAQRQKQQLQGAAAGPAGARGVQPQPRRVQQRHAVPRGQQQPVQPENRAPGQQQQPPQQRVVLGVPSWLGSTFSTYAGSINRRTAMTLLGVTAVVGASVGSVIALGGAGAESGLGTRSGGGGAYASAARGDGGMATMTSVTGESSPVPTSDILALGGADPPTGTALPVAFNSYADFDSPASEGEVPFFLHVPRSGGLTMMEIMGKCL